MSEDVTGSSFYLTPEGQINGRIIGESSIQLNEALVRKHARFGSGIVMGCGEGTVVAHFARLFESLTVLEGAQELLDHARSESRLPNVQFVHTWFERFELPADCRVDVVLGNHVLEHVDDPVGVLQTARFWLADNGVAIFTVPNAESLHRRIGLQMGMLQSLYELNERDHIVGHQRVYDAARLRQDLEAGGYKVRELGGFNLKLVSQKQMADWPIELHAAIYRVSQQCPPEICSNLYAVCTSVGA